MIEFSNFKKYDKKGNRLAIFARAIAQDKNKLYVTVITCSKKDTFIKNTSKEVYKKYIEGENNPIINNVVFHPNSYVIEIDNVATPKKCFLTHCYKEYCSLKDNVFSFKSPILDAKIGRGVKGSKNIIKVKLLSYGS